MTAHTDTAAGLSRLHPGSFARLVDAVGARLAAARSRRAEIGTLAAMSDRELADMSVSRTDVDRLFDPDFADEYRVRRATRRAASPSCGGRKPCRM